MWPHESLLDPVWQRVAIALAHFLWQGVLVAAAYSAIASCLRRPEQRYTAGIVALAVMAVCPLVTYAVVGPPIARDVSRIIADSGALATDAVLEVHTEIPAGMSPNVDWAALATEPDRVVEGAVIDEAIQSAPRATSWREALNRWIVMVWLAGVAICSLRLLAGAAGLRSLMRRTSPAEKEQLQIVERLARTLGLRRAPRLRISDGLAQAIATGVFRPMIVVPAAWLAELPPAVIEAVLAHELAHIRRYDLWVNLIQRAVEAVLFFHPGVWWLSRQIRSEREMCCDELAVSATREKVAYANALEIVARRAALGSRGSRRAGAARFSLATGIGGRKMQLLARVRHVLGLPAARRPGSLWGAGVLALAVPLGAWALSGPAAPFAFGQDEGERAQRERDEQRERQRAEREERRARQRAERDEQRQRQRRQAAEERERDERQRDEQERRRAEDDGDIGYRIGVDFDRFVQARAEELAQDARARLDKERKNQEQIRRELDHARNELKRRVGEAQEKIAAAIKEAEAAGQKDQVQALRNKLEALQQQAMAEAKAMEAKLAHAMGDLNMKADEAARAAARKAADAEAMMQKAQHELRERRQQLSEKLEEAHKQGDKAAVEKLHAMMEQLNAEHGAMREKLLHSLVEKLADKKDKMATDKVNKLFVDKFLGGDKVETTTIFKRSVKDMERAAASPEAQREVMQMIKELRGEVQALRREVQELRGQGGGVKSPKEKPKPKEKVSVLEEIPYVGRLFNKEEVEIEFVEPEAEKVQLDADDVEIELKLQKEALDKLDKGRLDDLKAIELENIEARNALRDVELELTETRDLEDRKNLELEVVRDKPIDDVRKVELEFKQHRIDQPNEALQRKLAQESVNDFEVRHAAKAAEVAKRQWEKSVEANKRVPGAIAETDLALQKLTYEKAKLEIERAKRDQFDRLSKLKAELQDLNKKPDDPYFKRVLDLHKAISKELFVDDVEANEKPKSGDITETTSKTSQKTSGENKEKPEPEKK
jgi:beta-lactamase regulating signal transducer with metallopeptidase domain